MTYPRHCGDSDSEELVRDASEEQRKRRGGVDRALEIRNKFGGLGGA